MQSNLKPMNGFSISECEIHTAVVSKAPQVLCEAQLGPRTTKLGDVFAFV